MEQQEQQERRGTRAHLPDLDWSQVRETVLMLELAAAQIEAAMREGNGSVEVLTNSFTSMANYMQEMQDGLASLSDEGTDGELKHKLLGNAGQVASMVHGSIVAFQFYDKLVQRLAHVRHGLEGLSGLVSDQRRLFVPYEWVALQDKIRSKYSMVEEVAMFEAVMNGMSVDEAVEHFRSQMQESDDIELF